MLMYFGKDVSFENGQDGKIYVYDTCDGRLEIMTHSKCTEGVVGRHVCDGHVWYSCDVNAFPSYMVNDFAVLVRNESGGYAFVTRENDYYDIEFRENSLYVNNEFAMPVSDDCLSLVVLSCGDVYICNNSVERIDLSRCRSFSGSYNGVKASLAENGMG